jgi:hypothetical protein
VNFWQEANRAELQTLGSSAPQKGEMAQMRIRTQPAAGAMLVESETVCGVRNEELIDEDW